MKHPTKLNCEQCGITPEILYVVDPWYYCVNCAEAEVRRKRFTDENEFWDEKPVDKDNAMQYNVNGG